jgi:hypothetical protein
LHFLPDRAKQFPTPDAGHRYVCQSKSEIGNSFFVISEILIVIRPRWFVLA